MPSSSEKGVFPYSFGWLPDLPDARDYTKDTPAVQKLLKSPSSVPKTVDLRAFCPPICNQGQIGSCTANAAAALLEYNLRRAQGKDTPTSRMFIYKCTRDLMMAKGDSGAYIRTTMGSLALFGAPPEKYWGYDEDIDRAPPAFCYSFAQNYQAISYFRLDEKSVGIPVKDKSAILTEIKSTLAQELPVMFGFQVYESIRDANDGKIPYPARGEKVIGGHAVLCVGYDDNLAIGASTGAFLIRNSWGEAWGEKGYGWLPYDYLLAGLAQDWWALVKAEWMNTEEFGV
ncbi:MAG: C1 family peptidase [Candidatus Micrarchaeia archaeon]